MQSISIGTSQNITIDYQLAGVGNRIVAFIIDSAVIGAYILICNLLITGIFQINSIAIFVVIGFLGYLYFLISEIYMNGQTLGKKSMGIKVVKLDGSRPGIGGYILRWIILPVDISLSGGIALIFIIFTKNGQRLGDVLAGTTVVKIRKGSDLLQRKKATIAHFEEDYEPVFPDAIKLNDEDIRLMEESLRAFKEHSQRKPMELMQLKMEEKTGIKSDMHPIRFLNTLIKDYTYYSMRQAGK